MKRLRAEGVPFPPGSRFPVGCSETRVWLAHGGHRGNHNFLGPVDGRCNVDLLSTPINTMFGSRKKTISSEGLESHEGLYVSVGRYTGRLAQDDVGYFINAVYETMTGQVMGNPAAIVIKMKDRMRIDIESQTNLTIHLARKDEKYVYRD